MFLTVLICSKALVKDSEQGKEVILREPKTLLFFSGVVFEGDRDVKPLRIQDSLKGQIAYALQEWTEQRCQAQPQPSIVPT